MVCYLDHVLLVFLNRQEHHYDINEEETIKYVESCFPIKALFRNESHPEGDYRTSDHKQNNYKDIPVDFVGVVRIDETFFPFVNISCNVSVEHLHISDGCFFVYLFNIVVFLLLQLTVSLKHRDIRFIVAVSRTHHALKCFHLFNRRVLWYEYRALL